MTVLVVLQVLVQLQAQLVVLVQLLVLVEPAMFWSSSGMSWISNVSASSWASSAPRIDRAVIGASFPRRGGTGMFDQKKLLQLQLLQPQQLLVLVLLVEHVLQQLQLVQLVEPSIVSPTSGTSAISNVSVSSCASSSRSMSVLLSHWPPGQDPGQALLELLELLLLLVLVAQLVLHPVLLVLLVLLVQLQQLQLQQLVEKPAMFWRRSATSSISNVSVSSWASSRLSMCFMPCTLPSLWVPVR